MKESLEEQSAGSGAGDDYSACFEGVGWAAHDALFYTGCLFYGLCFV